MDNKELLETLDIKGKTITADAMHFQKETCSRIIEKKGQYVFGLKENQKTLYNDVKLFIESKINQDSLTSHSTTDYGHGRYEKRLCYKVSDIDWLENRQDWGGKLFLLSNGSQQVSIKRQKKPVIILSVAIVSPEKLLQIVREHLKIESLHWMLDVHFSEDECQLQSDNGNRTLNSLRKLAILTHRTYLKEQRKKKSVKQNVLQCLINELVNVLNSL